MGLEIEHKYLVVNDGYRGMASYSSHIRQGYLSRVPGRTVRVRTRDLRGYITVKGITVGDVRREYEYEIPYEDACELLGLCEGKVIDKIRYVVPYEGKVWEVDEFHGANEGLVTAEIELPSSGCEYKRPPFVGENVTGNPAYYNSNLG